LNGDIIAALAAPLVAVTLESPLPGRGPCTEEKVFDTILFLAWHEAYHIGSIRAIRKEIRLKSTTELVRGR
jgi:hypothetical protein